MASCNTTFTTICTTFHQYTVICAHQLTACYMIILVYALCYSQAGVLLVSPQAAFSCPLLQFIETWFNWWVKNPHGLLLFNQTVSTNWSTGFKHHRKYGCLYSLVYSSPLIYPKQKEQNKQKGYKMESNGGNAQNGNQMTEMSHHHHHHHLTRVAALPWRLLPWGFHVPLLPLCGEDQQRQRTSHKMAPALLRVKSPPKH